MTISDSTLSQDVWTTIKNIIVASAPYVTKGASTIAASVESVYNDKRTTKPIIIVNPQTGDKKKDKFGTGGSQDINVTVDCYYSTTLGTDELADQVSTAIETAADEGTISGMELIGFGKDQAFVNPMLVKYQLASVTFIFKRE